MLSDLNSSQGFGGPQNLEMPILIKSEWYQIKSLMKVKKGFGYDKSHTFYNVMKHRAGIKHFLGKSLQYTNTFSIVLWS